MEELALHILDVAHNSIEAGASRIEIDVDEDPAADQLTIRIRDDGRGMDGETLARVTDPVFTPLTTRRVGMGLPLLKHTAEAAGGHVAVRSVAGAGTEIVATFQWSHRDRAPLGDLETTVLVLAVSHPAVDVVFSHRHGDRDYLVSSADVREALDGLPLSGPEGIALVREAVRSGETGLRAGGGSA
jgi:anti-sigma regulatory factor (Ser/Thr protein kinase)